MFHEIAAELSEAMEYPYDDTEAENGRAYLEHVRWLPEDAKEIYPD